MGELLFSPLLEISGKIWSVRDQILIFLEALVQQTM